MQPIGILDSGVGGLSVLSEIHRLLPHEALFYVADQAHLPYGEKTLEEVRHYSEGITRFLLAQGAKLIVIACNTASAAALHPLRQTFPDVPFVGLEPAIRPASQRTQAGKIAVIATAATFQGELYASLIERYAYDLDVIAQACPELVALAERGGPWEDEDYMAVADLLADIRESGADELVLGCTHFPFLRPLLQSALPHSEIIDPAPAVARQVARLLDYDPDSPPLAFSAQTPIYATSGPGDRFQAQIANLLKLSYPPPVLSRKWAWGGGGVVG
jgi:glutamate racemase